MMSAAPNELSPLASASGGKASKSCDAARTRFKERVESVLAFMFGVIFIGLSVIVCIETLSRKLFNFSIQGADELGGYTLALGSTLAFSLALMGRAHIRVDVIHDRLPLRWQALFNLLSIVSLAALGIFICWVAFQVLVDTQTYGSTAPTPWATPLIYPQMVWFAGLAMFALVASAYAARAIKHFLDRRTDLLLLNFSPKSAKEELKEELDDLVQRQEGVKQ